MQPQNANAARKARMSVLSRCDTARLRQLWDGLGLNPPHKTLRGPESGMVMLRGRVGGQSEVFNLGEATVTRASVRLEDGSVGHAMALGRDAKKALLSALIDAVCHDARMAGHVDAAVIEPMRRELDEADETRRRQTAATRVDFFTLVRGEDA
ncbi:MAG TPA: phosphonate C-P lyase system protein PhnG [Mesorhizobium sp.]